MFTNLKSLKILKKDLKEDIKLFLPKMKSLTSLTLPSFHIEKLDFIYTECRSLQTLEFNCYYEKEDFIVKNLERMIELVKSDIIHKNFPLTLVFE